MTQLLTYASSHNERTRGLVYNFLEMSKYKVQTIDVMKYPVFILMDIAQSNGVKDLLVCLMLLLIESFINIYALIEFRTFFTW